MKRKWNETETKLFCFTQNSHEMF